MSEELKPPQFPTMLRKMWSGSEVQAWIDENWNRKGDADMKPSSGQSLDAAIDAAPRQEKHE